MAIDSGLYMPFYYLNFAVSVILLWNTNGGDEMKFDAVIQERLAAKGWSQAELARRAGISKAGLNEVINGKAKVNLTRLISIAKALNVSVWKLVKEAEGK